MGALEHFLHVYVTRTCSGILLFSYIPRVMGLTWNQYVYCQKVLGSFITFLDADTDWVGDALTR